MKVMSVLCALLGLLFLFWVVFNLGEQKGFGEGYFLRSHPECDIGGLTFDEHLCQKALPTAPVGTLSWATSTNTH